MFADAMMLGDGVVSRTGSEMHARHRQLAQLEKEQRELQQLLQQKADQVFNLRLDLFMNCEHDWMHDRDSMSRYEESHRLCSQCNMYEHGPRKQFF